MRLMKKVKIPILPVATDGKFRVNGEMKCLRIINRKEAIELLEKAMGGKRK